MRVVDLGLMRYRDAWAAQEAAHREVVAGGEERILFVEHPPVITFGRRADDARRNLVASDEVLAALGVEVVESDRGGDITFHGPGQVVAYPIIRLNDHALSVGGYVRALENSVIAALGQFGICANREDGAVGVWVSGKKVCAIGVRVRRGVTLHGLALNLTCDLRYFELIVPCGLKGRAVTSVQQLRPQDCPSRQRVIEVLTEALHATIS